MRPSVCKWESTKVAGEESDNLFQGVLGSATFNTTPPLPLITAPELSLNNHHYWSAMTETALFPHLIGTWPCSSKHPSLLLLFSSLSTSFSMSHNHKKGSGSRSPSLSFVFLPPISFRSSYASLPSLSPTGNLGKVGQNEIWPQ